VNALKRILFVITSTQVGGAEKILVELAAHLHRQGVSVAVCSLKAKGPYSTVLEALGIQVHSLNMNDTQALRGILSYLMCLPRLIRVIAKVKPQIVHAFLFRANLLSRIASRLCGVPANISSIRIIENDRRFYFLLDRWTSFMVTQHLAVSERVKEATCQRSGIPLHRVKVICNGVDLKHCPQAPGECADAGPTGAKLAANLGILPGDRVCGTVARLRPQKGISYLLQAFMLLAQRFPALKLLIVGDGPEQSSLESLACQLGIRDRVVFAGLAASPWPYLNLMDVFVLPSLYEGLPNAVLEAMAAGVPVVATDVGGVAEIVEDQLTGLLIRPRDPEGIVNAVGFLLEQSKRASEICEAARKVVETKFSLQSMLREYDQLYAALAHSLAGE